MGALIRSLIQIVGHLEYPQMSGLQHTLEASYKGTCGFQFNSSNDGPCNEVKWASSGWQLAREMTTIVRGGLQATRGCKWAAVSRSYYLFKLRRTAKAVGLTWTSSASNRNCDLSTDVWKELPASKLQHAYDIQPDPCHAMIQILGPTNLSRMVPTMQNEDACMIAALLQPSMH